MRTLRGYSTKEGVIIRHKIFNVNLSYSQNVYVHGIVNSEYVLCKGKHNELSLMFTLLYLDNHAHFLLGNPSYLHIYNTCEEKLLG